MIFDAVEKVGVRALVSKGWGGMGDRMGIPAAFMLVILPMTGYPRESTPPYIVVVLERRQSGSSGKPTMTVPFFGDQPFWSAMIVKAGAGAERSFGPEKAKRGEVR